MLHSKKIFLGVLLLCTASFVRAQIVLAPTQTFQVSENHPRPAVGQPLFLTGNWADHTANVGLIQFDLSTISAPVLNATLSLFHDVNQVAGAKFGLYENLSGWSKDTVTWASRPSVDSTPAAVLAIATSDHAVGVFRTVDLTDLVNEWIAGSAPNYGVTLERMDNINPFAFFTALDRSFPDGSRYYAPTLTLTLAAVPEPATYGLTASIVLVAIMTLRRRFNRSGESDREMAKG
jgi:hypothetical protein